MPHASCLRRDSYLSALLAAGLLVSACSEQSDELALGQAASYLDAGGAAVLSMTVHSVTAANTCPSRVDGRELSGSFLLLDVEVALATSAEPPEVVIEADGTQFVPASAELFSIQDPAGAVVGGFDPATTWECYSDEQLLAPIVLGDRTERGLVVLESEADSGYVTITVDEATTWQWRFEIS